MAIKRPALIRDEVYQYLRRELLLGHYAPDMQLKVQQLTDTLQVSRTPVQDALKRLQQEGLLESLPRGFQVRYYSTKEAADIYDVREHLEVMAARLAATYATDQGHADIQHALKQLLASSQADVAVHIEHDMAFHGAIAKASHNDALFEIIQQLNTKLLNLRIITRDESAGKVSQEHHTQLARAIVARDPDKAAQVMSAHVLYYKELLCSRLALQDTAVSSA